MGIKQFLTPKEKAVELISKYKSLELEIGGEFDGYLKMKTFGAYQCALIAVEEIINDYPKFSEYWNDVKLELQLLSIAQP